MNQGGGPCAEPRAIRRSLLKICQDLCRELLKAARDLLLHLIELRLHAAVVDRSFQLNQ